MVIKIHHHRLVTRPLSTTPFPNHPSSSPSHLQPPASISPAQQRLIGQFDANHNQLTSATSIPNQRLDAIHTHIQTQDKTISDLSNAVRLDFQTSLRLILYLAEASHNFTSLEINLHSFVTAVESLKAGRLVPGLLHQEDIGRVLVKIARRLRTTKSQVRLLINNPTYFYRANNHVAVFHRNLLGISLKIPITTSF